MADSLSAASCGRSGDRGAELMEGDGATLLAGVGILGCRNARSRSILVPESLTHTTIQDLLAADGSIYGGGPRVFAIAVVSRSGDSNPAEGGGDGGATANKYQQLPYHYIYTYM